MKLGIMQSYFFPYIGYFQLIQSVSKFMIYEHVSFRKKSWITRNRIRDKGNGEVVFINIPVKDSSSFKNLSEIEIDQGKHWQKKLLNLLYYNYKKARYFDQIYPYIEQLLIVDRKRLHDLNAHVIISLCELFDIKTTITFQHEQYLPIEKKLIDLAVQNELEIKTQRIIEICKNEASSIYVNPIGGRELYDRDQFSLNDVKLQFIKSEDIAYQQFNFNFEANLSILDVLMHNGVSKTKELISLYNLV